MHSFSLPFFCCWLQIFLSVQILGDILSCFLRRACITICRQMQFATVLSSLGTVDCAVESGDCGRNQLSPQLGFGSQAVSPMDELCQFLLNSFANMQQNVPKWRIKFMQTLAVRNQYSCIWGRTSKCMSVNRCCIKYQCASFDSYST